MREGAVGDLEDALGVKRLDVVGSREQTGTDGAAGYQDKTDGGRDEDRSRHLHDEAGGSHDSDDEGRSDKRGVDDP